MSYQALLKELFIGDISVMQQQMKDLTEGERKALFKQFSPLIAALDKLLRHQQKQYNYNYWTDVRKYSLDKLYQHYERDPDSFLQLKWREEYPKAHTYELLGYEETIREFFNRMRALEVGLGTQRFVTRGLKRRSSDLYTLFMDFSSQNAAAQSDYSLRWLGEILLDRPEAWKQAIFFKLCASVEKWQEVYATGFAQLLAKAVARYPEWAGELQAHYAKAMTLDGFKQARWYEKFPLEMITAGYAVSQTPVARIPAIFPVLPVLNSNIVDETMSAIKAGTLPRRPFIEMALRELLNPHAPAPLRAWCRFHEKLVLTAEEKAEFAPAIIDLVNSMNGDAIKIGLAEMAELWQCGRLSVEEMIAPICLAIQHQLPAVALAAHSLLKRIVTKGSIDASTIVPTLIDALNSPHAKLRLATIKLLVKLHRQLTEEHRQQLAEIFQTLTISEQGELKELLPAGAVVEPSAPVDRRAEISEIVAQASAMNLTDKKIAGWLNYLRHYLASDELMNNCAVALASGAIENDLRLPQSPRELVLELIERVDGEFGALDFERYLAAIINYRDAVDEEEIRVLFEPFKIHWQEWEIYEKFQQLPACDIAALLAYGWYRKGDLPILDLMAEHYNYYDNSFEHTLLMPTLYCVRRINQAFRMLKAGRAIVPLATPTSSAGWIDLESFTERLLALAGHEIEWADLIMALYRLPQHKEPRAAAWALLKAHVEKMAPAIAQALALALAADDEAERAVAWFKEHFQIYPPVLGRMETVLRRSVHKWDEQCEQDYRNVCLTFQLYCAALRARHGLADTSALNVQNLFIDNYNQYESGEGTEKKINAIMEELLFNPRPMDSNWLEDKQGGKINTSYYYYYNNNCLQSAYFPHLLPYHYYYCPYIGAMPDGEGGSEAMRFFTHLFPAGAQRFFELGLALLARAKEYGHYYTSLAAAFIVHIGVLFNIEIDACSVKAAVSLLCAKEARTREKAIDLLFVWLEQGRCTPTEVAQEMATLIIATEKGFKYLNEALGSVAIAHRTGNYLLMLTMEKVLGDADGLTPRKLLAIFRHLESAMATNATIRDERAIATVKKIATQRTAVAGIARHIAARLADRPQPPLEVEIVSELLIAAVAA